MQAKNAEKRQKVPEEEKKIDIPVDFDSLQKENPDIYAWITIPDTVIDYPIVQSSEDNAYYLNHSAEKTDSVSGAIYSENYNKKNFDDPITLLYGHNMKDGSMFASLLNYRDKNYLIEHPDIIVYLPDKKITYHIYAAVTFDDRYIMDSYNFDTLSGREEYLNDIRTFGENGGVFQDDIVPTKENQLITLSTCTDNQMKDFLWWE